MGGEDWDLIEGSRVDRELKCQKVKKMLRSWRQLKSIGES
jgi:hypothetical protein